MQLSDKSKDCLQAYAFGERYMSATNTEKPEVSKWHSHVEVKPAGEHEVRVHDGMSV